MKNLKLICLLAVSMVIASCQKVLDIDPDKYIIRSETYYATELQLQTALMGVYASLADDALYANHMLGRMGLEADEGFESYNADRYTVGYYAVSAVDTKILAYWTSLYTGINRANAILESINTPVMDENKRGNIKGQALFLRGYYYFMLVNKFGDVPLILKQTKSGNADEVQIARTPAKQVYEQIIADMKQAADLVLSANEVESSGRVHKTAVWGMLSRVCLYMAGNPINDTSKYEEAAKWANLVITSGYHELNKSYQQIFINYAEDRYDIKESIWEVEFWGNGTGAYNTTGGMVGRNNGISNTGDDNIGYSIGVTHPTTWLYSLYTSNDLRRDWAIAPFYYSGNPATRVYWTTGTIYQRHCGKYRREYELLKPKSQTRTPQNFPLLRYADVLLMYAEAANEANQHGASFDITEIFQRLNQVRRRAIGVDVNGGASSADISSADYSYSELRDEIRDERARELCFESLRKNDLVRWGLLLANMKTILLEVPPGVTVFATSAKATYTNVSERDVLWPIPSYEMGVNRKLVQNIGW